VQLQVIDRPTFDALQRLSEAGLVKALEAAALR